MKPDTFEITEDELALWKEQPVTVMVRKHLERVAERAVEIWTRALQADMKTDDLVALKIELQAKIQFIEDFQDITIEDIHDSQANQRSGAKG